MADKGRRILRGILITALACLALLVVIVVGFVVWLRQPGQLIDTTRLINADATGYAEWTLRPDDPGTDGFLRLLAEALSVVPQDAGRALPPVVDMLLGSTQAARLQQELEDALPAVVAWTMHPPGRPGGGDLHLVSVTARHFGNRVVLADWIGGFALGHNPASTVHRYNGENIYQIRLPRWPRDLTFFARRGAVFATSDLETARQAVDLLAAEGTAPSGPPETDLERLFATTAAESPLRAVATNGQGELGRVWGMLTGEEPGAAVNWLQVRGATLTGGLGADGSFDGVMALLTTATALDAWAPALASALRHRFEDYSFDANVEATPGAGVIRIDIHVSNLVATLTKHLRRATRR